LKKRQTFKRGQRTEQFKIMKRTKSDTIEVNKVSGNSLHLAGDTGDYDCKHGIIFIILLKDGLILWFIHNELRYVKNIYTEKRLSDRSVAILCNKLIKETVNQKKI